MAIRPSDIETTNDPIRKGAGVLALGYAVAGEGFAQLGNAEAVGALLSVPFRILRGGKTVNGSFPKTPKGTPIVLKDGFYEAGGMRISQGYYNRLWREGRPAPFLVTREILKSGVKGVPDAIKPGFFRYECGGWELVYNPVTKEIWHLQPLR